MGSSITQRAKGFLQRIEASRADYITLSGLIPLDDTKPQSSEGHEVLTLTIAAENAANLIFIDGIANIGHSINGANGIAALFRNSETDAINGGLFIGPIPSNNYPISIPLSLCFVAGTTSPITLKMRVGATSDTAYLNGLPSGRIGGGSLKTWFAATEYRVPA